MTMSRRKKRGPQPSYPLSVKQAAVRRVEAGESLSSVAREVGCGAGRIHYWVKQWQAHGGHWPELRRVRRRRSERAPPGSAEREAELERLLGQKQAELDFLGEALRRIEQAGRPTVEPSAPSPGRSSPPGRLGRKAG